MYKPTFHFFYYFLLFGIELIKKCATKNSAVACDVRSSDRELKAVRPHWPRTSLFYVMMIGKYIKWTDQLNDTWQDSYCVFLSLQQNLHEKWDEFRSLMVQEQRLVHGEFLVHDNDLTKPGLWMTHPQLLMSLFQ